jgi:hypothetical protein
LEAAKLFCVPFFQNLSSLSRLREMTQSLHPLVLWAQREDLLFVTINVADCKDEQLKLSEQGLSFKGVAAGADKKTYECDLEFYAAINPNVRILKGFSNCQQLIE